MTNMVNIHSHVIMNGSVTYNHYHNCFPHPLLALLDRCLRTKDPEHVSEFLHHFFLWYARNIESLTPDIESMVNDIRLFIEYIPEEAEDLEPNEPAE